MDQQGIVDIRQTDTFGEFQSTVKKTFLFLTVKLAGDNEDSGHRRENINGD